ncbi:MAG: Sensor protein resE [Candidatus Magasanikbacteria bacterium GW2011_GWA2_56_11]|uniref:histidine kinase n=1 Tax=Candidatus Magasanikbacteria bacterium GW2011_GWA2_56_11 TaxID=1619044 RepID=A0A0G2BBL3_9BACT|nr:MAG: Sensor protein resE [Candidatus Magasanikbacteria bacterium GW2011_GWA2_56_11]
MFYYDTQTVELLLGAFTFFVSTYLGVTILHTKPASATHRLFLALAVLIDVYVVVNYLSLHPPGATADSQLFWVRVVMATTSVIGPALVLLVHTFPEDRITLGRRYLAPLFTLMILSVCASLLPLVFTGIEYRDGEPVPIPGPGIVVFLLDFVGLFILSFAILIVKFRRARGEERQKHLHLLLGVLSSFSLMALSTVIFVVVLETSVAVFLGPLYPIILMIFIAYAIARYQLFDIKGAATTILSVMLWFLLFAKLLVSESASEFMVDLLVLALAVLFGIFLIRSIKREVKQREELSSLARSLAAANDQLKELDRQKTEFLSIASHQLRTPLSIIKGYIELIHDGAYGRPTKALREVLGNMDESNERLVKLVDEFLDITRIEQGRTKFDFAPTDLGALVDSVVKELEKRASDKGLEIAWKKPSCPPVPMDAEKIRHVVFNFVDNAIKYSERGRITVRVHCTGAAAEVSVADEGIGFGRADQGNFFQKFYRGENTRTVNVNGTGLGLYVCRKFIEAHRGTVEAASPGAGKGSTFRFSIPSAV